MSRVRRDTPGVRRRPPSARFPNGGQVRYRDGGNMTRRRTFDTRQEALDFQAGVRTDKARGDFVDDRLAKTPFRDVADEWFEGTAHLRPTTRAGYRSMLETYIKPGLGTMRSGRSVQASSAGIRCC